MNIGMIGFSEDNGHPFSFSAILNGYDDAAFARTGWSVIHTYLRRRRPEEFGLGEARVTHAWMPDPEMSRRLASACNIAHPVSDPMDMLGCVDAVIIARDDAASHASLALPFLERGVPVFVDKPLTLDQEELEAFRPYLAAGRLMSCSGLRYAVELDSPRAGSGDYGGVMALRCAVVSNWERYGVHMLDIAFSLIAARPVRIQRLAAGHTSFAIELSDGALLSVDCLGASEPVFNLTVVGRSKTTTHDVRDNFSAFRRTLSAFLDMVRTVRPPFPPEDTVIGMRTLMAGLAAEPGGLPVRISLS
jgi:hypothetical protein